MNREPPAPSVARRNDAAKVEFLEGLALMREGALKAAKALLAIDRDGHFVLEGYASLEEFGERNRSTAWETRSLANLGRAVEASPAVEERYRSGRVPFPSAALLGRVLSDSRLVRPGEDWLAWAETEGARTFRRRVSQRIEEVRLGDQPAVAMTFFVSEKGRDDFARARVIASRKADRALTEGETLEQVVDHYLLTFDPLRKREASRRLPHTATVRGRYVPAQARREVAGRDGDRCAVPLCDHDMFLQNAHIVPHARGGHREAGNLLRLCSRHHKMFDEGRLRMLGTANDPRFVDEEGRPLGAPGEKPPEAGRDPPGSTG